MKSKKIILVLVFLLILTLLTTENIEFRTKNNVIINFEKSVGKININYGANEDDNWVDFVNSPEIHNYHKNINSEYIRVWVSSQSYRESTIPLQDDGNYDFTNLDKFINAVLKSDAIPFIVFAHAPGTYGEGHGEDPPVNDAEFAVYIQTIVQHYKDACENNQLAKPCDVNDWYFEIWNEPYTDIWWKDNPPRYITMYNIVYPRIKAIAPYSKVGGFSGSFLDGRSNTRLKKFLQNSQMDFISIHHYGNILDENPSKKQKMENMKFIHYDSILALRDFIEQYQYSNDIQIIEGEYNSDSRAEHMKYLDEPFTAAWYASALIWQIKSQEVSLELFYSGTSALSDGGFGMWNFKGVLFPSYYMKKSFVRYNKKGSSILETTSSSNLDILAIENDDGRVITIVNKKDKRNVLEITLLNEDFKKLIDLDNQEQYSVLNNAVKISLQPYEVRFLNVN